MIKTSEKSLEFMRKYFENAEELLRSNDPNDVLDAIDVLILGEGFEEDFEGYNDFGREAQRVYDEIFDMN